MKAGQKQDTSSERGGIRVNIYLPQPEALICFGFVCFVFLNPIKS